MDEIPEAREIPDPTVEEMVGSIESSWEPQTIDAAERGFCSVHKVAASSKEPPQKRYLKVSPDGQSWGIPVEARIQAILDTHTSIPVPEVCGIVDDHEALPTPFYLMSALPGEEVPYEYVAQFEDDVLRRLARETGEYLAELHSIPAVDRFGLVRHDGPELAGGRPNGDPASVTVGNPCEDWPTYLRERVNQALDRHADSRFSELTDELDRWFEEGIRDLNRPFDPVLGRNDHGLHNLLVDPETGEITAMLDWAYTLAVPAAFDFEFAVYLFSGAFLAGLPDVSDRRTLVRNAMLSGYRTTAPALVETLSTPEPLYEALAMIRIMNDFEHLDIPNGTETAVMDRIRRDVRTLLACPR